MVRGDILLFGGRASVALRVLESTVVILPIVPRWGAAHRGDVDASDQKWPAVPVKRPVIRAGDAIEVRRAPQTIVGAVSPALLAQIEAAVRREAQARAIEAGAWSAMARPMRAGGVGPA